MVNKDDDIVKYTYYHNTIIKCINRHNATDTRQIKTPTFYCEINA